MGKLQGARIGNLFSSLLPKGTLESIGIKSFHYNSDTKDIESVRNFLENNL